MLKSFLSSNKFQNQILWCDRATSEFSLYTACNCCNKYYYLCDVAQCCNVRALDL